MEGLGVSGSEKCAISVRKVSLQGLIARQTSMIQESEIVLGWLGDFWANADGLFTNSNLTLCFPLCWDLGLSWNKLIS